MKKQKVKTFLFGFLAGAVASALCFMLQPAEEKKVVSEDDDEDEDEFEFLDLDLDDWDDK